MKPSVLVTEGLTITEPRWMISMPESEFKIGIMTCPNKRRMMRFSMPIVRTNPVWKIDHQEGVELEDRRRFQRTMPQPPLPPAQGSNETTTFTPEIIQQGMQRLFVAYNQCVTRVAQVDDRLEQFKAAIRRDALELALSIKRANQDLQQQGLSVERIQHTLLDEIQEKMTHVEETLRMFSEHMDTVAKTDKNEHAKSASIEAMIREQADLRRLIEGLATRLDHPQEARSVVPSEFSTAIQLEISDLKAKVLHLTQQNTEQGGKLTFLTNMSEQVDLMEQQIIKWRYRLPDLTEDDSRENVVTAVEVQEELDAFKYTVMRKIRELATSLAALEGEVRLLERDRDESWEAVSHKVSTLVDGSMSALTERLTELEHTVQSRMTTPVTDDSLTHVDAWSSIEQALMSELGKVREDYAQEIPRLYELCEHLHENQKY